MIQNHRGLFVSPHCTECGNGSFQYDGGGWWLCDGLLDPGHENKELAACMNGFEGVSPLAYRVPEPGRGTK